MKGFIEVTRIDEANKILVSVSQIKYVEEVEGFGVISLACIELFRKRRAAFQIVVAESYSEVIAKIARALD